MVVTSHIPLVIHFFIQHHHHRHHGHKKIYISISVEVVGFGQLPYFFRCKSSVGNQLWDARTGVTTLFGCNLIFPIWVFFVWPPEPPLLWTRYQAPVEKCQSFEGISTGGIFYATSRLLSDRQFIVAPPTPKI